MGAGNGDRGHVLLAGATNVTVTNANTASGTTASTTVKLLGSIAGVVAEVQCTGMTGTGALTNGATSVTGTTVSTYTGCTVPKPLGQGCVVPGGSFTTEPIEATSVGQPGSDLKFLPKAPAPSFATITFSSCSIPALNNSYALTGSFVAKTSGATVTTAHAAITGQNTLKFAGVKAGIETALTIRNQSGSPIGLT